MITTKPGASSIRLGEGSKLMSFILAHTIIPPFKSALVASTPEFTSSLKVSINNQIKEALC